MEIKELFHTAAGVIEKTREGISATPRPSGVAKSCRYCAGRSGCIRTFYKEDSQTDICSCYADMESPEELDRFKKLSEIRIPVPRREGDSRDCLNCCRLPVSYKCRPHHGRHDVCIDYYEIAPRKPEAAKTCFTCYNNHGCRFSRIERGPICELYGDYIMNPVEEL